MKSKNIVIFRIISSLLLISVMILIFFLSSENAAKSSNTSGSLIAMFVKIFTPEWDSLSQAERLVLIAPYQFIVRKAAHFTIYAVLGIFSFLAFITYKNCPIKIRYMIIFGFCLAYSISDEIHQLFVPGRCGDLRDVCVDFCGSIVGILFLSLISRFKTFKKYI